jgi:type IV pilus assembly protein PilX
MFTAHSSRSTVPHRQGGAVLFVALIFLVLITLLGLTATGTSVLQERMTGGMRSGQMALMGAETGLRGAEFNVWYAPQLSAAGNNLTLYCSSDGSGGCYSPDQTGAYASSTSTFATASGWTATTSNGGTAYATSLTGLTGTTQSASLGAQPQYLIQLVGPDLPPGSTGQVVGSNQQQNGGNNTVTKYIYTITARGAGGSTNTVRVVQSTFAAVLPQY